VPALHGEALFDAAPGPKRMVLFDGAGHNDLIARAGGRWAEAIATWACELDACCMSEVGRESG
jgi:pimeloyl-ACP methyl ester carboxylesterase